MDTIPPVRQSSYSMGFFSTISHNHAGTKKISKHVIHLRPMAHDMTIFIDPIVSDVASWTLTSCQEPVDLDPSPVYRTDDTRRHVVLTFFREMKARDLG